GGSVTAREAVVALGPWSDLVFGPLGYSMPFAVKRGYHLHLAARGNAVLHHPVLDADQGFVLAPMSRGIRLTTGVEFARRDAPATPIQVECALPKAHKLFPLGEPVDARPSRAVVRFRPPASRADAGAGEWTPARGNDDGRKAVRRSEPVRGRTVRL